MRETKATTWRHVMVSATPTPAVFVEIKDGSSQYPLYQYADAGDALFDSEGARSSNLDERVVGSWFRALGDQGLSDGTVCVRVRR